MITISKIKPPCPRDSLGYQVRDRLPTLCGNVTICTLPVCKKEETS